MDANNHVNPRLRPVGTSGMICAMQTLSIDSNDFAEIRQSKFLYVDKTACFHRLAKAETADGSAISGRAGRVRRGRR